MEKREHIVILAAGDFPTHEVPLQALHDADFVVCCDSAYIRWKELQEEKPFIVIGDGDSLTEEAKQQLGSRYIRVEEQDYNDLHKAMVWATSKFNIQHSTFSIIGATGRREDHTLGNISYLTTFASEYPGADIEMLTDYGRFVYFNGRHTYSSFPRQQVSIFSLRPDVPVTTTGLRWTLQGNCLTVWWQGTLNEALGNSFTVDGGPGVIFQTYNAKD